MAGSERNRTFDDNDDVLNILESLGLFDEYEVEETEETDNWVPDDEVPWEELPPRRTRHLTEETERPRPQRTRETERDGERRTRSIREMERDGERRTRSTRETERDGERRPRPEKRKETRNAKTKWLWFVLKLAAAAVCGWLMLHFVLGVFVCHTNDMYPAVRDGDLIFTWRLRNYKVGDIAAYRHEGKRSYGRVAALPGDVVNIDGQGNCTVNGSAPDESVYYATAIPESSTLTYPYTVQEGELFVLSDLRENMRDSREFGGIPRKDTDGNIVFLMRRRGW